MDNAERNVRGRGLRDGRGHRDARPARAARGRPGRVAAARSSGSSTTPRTSSTRSAGSTGPERDQVVADFEAELARLEAAYDLLTHVPDPLAVIAAADPAGEVRLQASWAAGKVVVWAAGPGTAPGDNDELADRLEAIGGPRLGWSLHADVPLPVGSARRPRSPSRWRRRSAGSVAVGGGLGRDGVGASVAWLGRVAVAAVRLVAHGSVVPTLARREAGQRPSAGPRRARGCRRCSTPPRSTARRSHARPGRRPQGRNGAGRSRSRCSAPWSTPSCARPPAGSSSRPRRPTTQTTAAVAEAFVTRLDGSAFDAPVAAGAEVSKRLDRWAKPVTERRPAHARRAARPARQRRRLVPLGARARRRGQPPADRGRRSPTARPPSRWPTSWPASSGIFPALLRAGGPAPRPGVPEPGRGVGADDRHRRRRSRPPASTCGCPRCRAARPTPGAAAVHRADRRLRRRRPPARQRALVGGVRRRRAHRRRDRPARRRGPPAGAVPRQVGRARPGRPQGGGRRAGRAGRRRPSSPAPRSSATPSASRARRSAGGVRSRAAAGPPTCSSRPSDVSTEPVTSPEGFDGELRSYQAEALAWLGFLDAVELGGCLALDMGLGKTPDGARPPRPHRRATARRSSIAPPAVVGNWAAEAARFTPEPAGGRPPRRLPGRRPTSSRREVAERRRRHHHLRHRRARRRGARPSARGTGVVLDEAQAIKNPANETAQQLRRIPARSRIALTGTRSRTASATCGPSSTSPTRAWSAPGRRSSPSCRARARPRCGRSTASSCSAAPRASPRWPPSCPTASTSSTTAR